MDQVFYGRLKPISKKWIPEALAITGFTREETLRFDDPKVLMDSFAGWIRENIKDRPLFGSDNNGFDWQFINWYFWHFTGGNPFGHSSTSLGSLYKGMVKIHSRISSICGRPHTHNPVHDARGSAKALLAMKAMGLKIAL